MKISILGAGNVGVPVARSLAAAGHAVNLSNSRGPETIRQLAESIGVTAMSASDAVRDAEVIITAVNPGSYAQIGPMLVGVSEDVTVIDTGNYHPFRDGQIAAIDEGQLEALWIAEQLGRPIARAWNAITAQTIADGSRPAGSPDRIAVPVAGDDPRDRKIAAILTDDTGFDPLDIGGLENTWRAHPGTSAYCTELPLADLQAAIDRADRASAPIRRDLCAQAFKTFGEEINDGEKVLRLHRAITLTPDPA